MKIQIASDLHLEYLPGGPGVSIRRDADASAIRVVERDGGCRLPAPDAFSPAPDRDVLVLAGDIGTDPMAREFVEQEPPTIRSPIPSLIPSSSLTAPTTDETFPSGCAVTASELCPKHPRSRNWKGLNNPNDLRTSPSFGRAIGDISTDGREHILYRACVAKRR